jgi:hypothetical protein
MKDELEKKIYERWPNWFRPQGPITDTLIPFGLPGDGWFQVIWDLCEKLEALGEEALKGFEVTQVKEKFGGLRFYYKGGNPELIDPLVSEAEVKADETCEQCGKPGRLRGNRGWILTLCDECDKATSQA